MGGTFVYFSWDIMEPISYLMLLGNFVIGFFFYTALKRNMELTALREMLSMRFANRMYRRQGLDIKKLETMQKEILELRSLMNKSIY